MREYFTSSASTRRGRRRRAGDASRSMNRGVEINSQVADHPEQGVMEEQVAVRMAVLDRLSRS